MYSRFEGLGGRGRHDVITEISYKNVKTLKIYN